MRRALLLIVALAPGCVTLAECDVWMGLARAPGAYAEGRTNASGLWGSFQPSAGVPIQDPPAWMGEGATLRDLHWSLEGGLLVAYARSEGSIRFAYDTIPGDPLPAARARDALLDAIATLTTLTPPEAAAIADDLIATGEADPRGPYPLGALLATGTSHTLTKRSVEASAWIAHVDVPLATLGSVASARARVGADDRVLLEGAPAIRGWRAADETTAALRALGLQAALTGEPVLAYCASATGDGMLRVRLDER